MTRLYNEEPRPFTRYQVFAVLLALAVLFHEMSYGNRLNAGSTVLLFCAAWLVLVKPSFAPFMVALCVFELIDLWNKLPAAANHYVLSGFCVLGILVALVVLIVRRRSWRISSEDWFDLFAPVCCLNLVLLYAFTVFHKLNLDYLNPQTSCAVDLYNALASRYTLLPPPNGVIGPSLIAGTLLVETLIPVLLSIRRTRRAGVVLGIAFHTILALEPTHEIYNFTSFLMALYFLFIADDLIGPLNRVLLPFRLWWRRITGGRAARLALSAFIYAVAFDVTFVLGFRDDLPDARLTLEHGRVLWVIYAIIVVGIWLATWRYSDPSGQPRRVLIPAHPLLALVSVLVIFNGLSPYLGLKTETSFSMFSNLRTEGGETNHVLVPTWTQIWGFQRDTVRVIESSSRALRTLADDNVLMVWFDFRTLARRYRRDSLTYERNGEVFTVRRIADAPEFAAVPPYLEQKLLKFRSITFDGSTVECGH